MDEFYRVNTPNVTGGAPVGFGYEIYENADAMKRYSGMSEAEKQQVMDDMRGMRSGREAREYARRLADQGRRN